MSNGVARIGDTVHGYCDGPGHEYHREFVGTWQTGSETIYADEIGVVRVGDTGITDCGHTFVAVTGSETGFADELQIHRVNDVVIVQEGGVGVTVTGSETVLLEG